MKHSKSALVLALALVASLATPSAFAQQDRGGRPGQERGDRGDRGDGGGWQRGDRDDRDGGRGRNWEREDRGDRGGRGGHGGRRDHDRRNDGISTGEGIAAGAIAGIALLSLAASNNAADQELSQAELRLQAQEYLTTGNVGPAFGDAATQAAAQAGTTTSNGEFLTSYAQSIVNAQ